MRTLGPKLALRELGWPICTTNWWISIYPWRTYGTYLIYRYTFHFCKRQTWKSEFVLRENGLKKTNTHAHSHRYSSLRRICICICMCGWVWGCVFVCGVTCSAAIEFITFTCKLRQTTLLCKLPTANGERNWFSCICRPNNNTNKEAQGKLRKGTHAQGTMEVQWLPDKRNELQHGNV